MSFVIGNGKKPLKKETLLKLHPQFLLIHTVMTTRFYLRVLPIQTYHHILQHPKNSIREGTQVQVLIGHIYSLAFFNPFITYFIFSSCIMKSYLSIKAAPPFCVGG